jgi:hypothetical protein
VSEWKPIETAPDWADVILCPGLCKKRTLGFRDARTRLWFDHDAQEEYPLNRPPVWWMPLPEPPR